MNNEIQKLLAKDKGYKLVIINQNVSLPIY